MEKSGEKEIMAERITAEDIQKALERYDWDALERKVQKKTAPEIEAYRVAAIQSRANIRRRFIKNEGYSVAYQG